MTDASPMPVHGAVACLPPHENRIPVLPNVAKVGGLRSQGAEGAAVVHLLQALGNAGSGVLRLSRRGKKIAYNRPNPQVHLWFVPRIGP